MWLAVGLVAALALVSLYASWTARRLHRLHARVDAAAAGLHGQLALRADAAVALAESGVLPTGPAAALGAAAARAQMATGLGRDREGAENTLSRALQLALATCSTPAYDGADVVAMVADAAARASMARRFHNDAVRDALVVHRRRVVRLLHLAGHAPRPTYFEIDDAPLEFASAPASLAPYD